MNRRLAAWTKGLTAEALKNVSERRGSALVLFNAAYTSQVDPDTHTFGVRKGDRLHCASGVVWQADHAAAINVLARLGDPDITLYTPHTRVKQILQERADRQRIRLPIQDSTGVAVSRATRVMAELIEQVTAVLEPGERLVATGWFARATGRRSAGEVFSESMRPRNLADGLAAQALGMSGGEPEAEWFQAARGGAVDGAPGSHGVGMDAALAVDTVVVLAVTEQRVLVLRQLPSAPPPAGLLAQLGSILRAPRPSPVGPLELVWQAPRAALRGVVMQESSRENARLVLGFTDGSWVALGAVRPMVEHVAAALV